MIKVLKNHSNCKQTTKSIFTQSLICLPLSVCTLALFELKYSVIQTNAMVTTVPCHQGDGTNLDDVLKIVILTQMFTTMPIVAAAACPSGFACACYTDVGAMGRKIESGQGIG
jgi:hypothetical protein